MQVFLLFFYKNMIMRTGYTLDHVGIGHMTPEQLQAWLREGVYTPAN